LTVLALLRRASTTASMAHYAPPVPAVTRQGIFTLWLRLAEKNATFTVRQHRRWEALGSTPKRIAYRIRKEMSERRWKFLTASFL
jgi:hypothetical protein